jgi:hypothetical protein
MSNGGRLFRRLEREKNSYHRITKYLSAGYPTLNANHGCQTALLLAFDAFCDLARIGKKKIST